MSERLLSRFVRRGQRAMSSASLRAQRNLLPRRSPRAMHFRQCGGAPSTCASLTSVRGAGQGRRCVILGTSPAVKDIDISLASSDYVMMLNRAYLLAPRLGRTPDALVMSNPYAMSEYGAEAMELDWRHVFLSDAVVARAHDLPKSTFAFAQWEAPRMSDGFFQTDGSKPLYQAGSVAHSALQIAVWMRFNAIILAGIDLDFPSEEPHFYSSSNGERARAQRASRQNQPEMVRGFCVARRQISALRSTTVVNAGISGTANPFPHVEWANLFSASAKSRLGGELDNHLPAI